MLVFISDLHFVDGSAGEHNIPYRAFEYFFDDLAVITQQAKRKAKQLKEKGKFDEVKLVLLGDIFDLLRTEAWFDGINEEQRPWGTKDHQDEVGERALAILDAVMCHKNIIKGVDNARALESIQTGLLDLKEQCELDFTPGLEYIPGNHDRLVNKRKYGKLRRRECLGLEAADPEKQFFHYFYDPAYGVLARHGHEFDKYNYEGSSAFNYQDYQRVPIGDPITTELIVRLPYELANQLKNTTLPPAEHADPRTSLRLP